MKALETAENNRSQAMQAELARQIRLYKLADRFEEEKGKLEKWISEKEAYLKKTEECTSIASAQRNLNVLDSFKKEWESTKGTKLAVVQELASTLEKDNYHDKSSITSKSSAVENKFHNLTPLTEQKRDALEKDLETEKKKEQLRLDFASAAKDFELYALDQVEIIQNDYFGDNLEEVQAHEESLSSSEQQIRKSLDKMKATYEQVWAELEKMKVSDNKYTSLTPTDLEGTRSKVEDAFKARREAYNAELAKQKAEDELARTYAEKASSFQGWIEQKKKAVSDKSQALEQKLELVKKELEGVKGEAEPKIAELEGLDAKLAEAGIIFNKYAKSSTQEAKIALNQYLGLLEKLREGLEAEYAQKISKGIDEEQRKEIADNFDYFDKDKSGFLERKEFRACLQSLGQNASPADVRDALAAYDKDADGKISREEFVDYMIKRIGDTDTQEQILEDFTVINQKDYADDDHMNAVVNDTTFPPERFEYLKAEMKPQEDGYNFQQWTQEVFDR